MASATLEPNVALDNSMGAMMIGVIISAVLHGITLLQAFMYWTTYKKDIWYLKSLVVITVSFDAIHLAMISHAVYHHLVSHYHDPNNLLNLTWTVLIEALFTGVNGGIVQTFYTIRVFRLSRRNYYLTGLILFLILCTVSCGLVWVILSMQFKTYRQLLTISPLTITINALSTSVDIMIAASLVFLLYRSRTGFKRQVRDLLHFFTKAEDFHRSDTIIKKLIVFVVNTGVLTTFCAIASLICLVKSPRSLLYASFYFCIGRLYTNSFLATLNARNSLSSDVDDTTNMMASIPPSVVSPQATTGSMKMKSIAIRIDTTTHKEGKSQNSDQGRGQTHSFATGVGDDSKYDDQMHVHHTQTSSARSDIDDDGVVKAIHL